MVAGQEISNMTAPGTSPDRVNGSMRGKVRKLHDLANKIPYDAAPILDELRLDGRAFPESTQDAA